MQVVPQLFPCPVSNRNWIVTGIVIGIMGSLVILCGVMWAARDVLQQWVQAGRSRMYEEAVVDEN